MKKVTAKVNKVTVRNGKNWIPLGAKPSTGDRVNLDLKVPGTRPLYIGLFLSPDGFNDLGVRKLGTEVVLAYDEDLVETKEKYDKIMLSEGDAMYRITEVEVPEDFKEFDFAFGEVEATTDDDDEDI